MRRRRKRCSVCWRVATPRNSFKVGRGKAGAGESEAKNRKDRQSGASSPPQKRKRLAGATRNNSHNTRKKKRRKGGNRREDHTQEKAVFVPPLLFSADSIPEKGRINSYSKPEYMLDIVDVLQGSAEYEWLRESCFGKLFDLPTRRCSPSGKVIHQLLCRTMVTKKRYEMWFVFGGYPLRFSLREFDILTGLNCGPYPAKEACNWMEQTGMRKGQSE